MTDKDIALIQKDIDYMKEEMNSLKLEIIEIKKLFGTFIEKADNRYAGKTTERIVYGLVGIVLTAVTVAIVAVVVK